MPSPACEVKEGAGAYGSTDDGVDVTPAATITIRLISGAGVNSWSIECVYADDESDAEAVTASLTIDTVARTATFTAPAAGKAYIFRSRINGGVDVNGRAQSTYATTFGIYTLTSESLRVLAANETTEGSSSHGWAKSVNAAIRASGGGGAGLPSGPSNGDVLGYVSGAAAWAKAGAARKAVATTGTISDLSLLDASSNPVGTIGMTGGTATINSFAGGWDGRLLFVTNEHATLNVTIPHQTGGTAANRVITVDGASLVLGPAETALLRYDGTATRWRVMFAWAAGDEVSVPAAGIVTSDGSALGSFTPGAGVQTFLGTPSSANLRGALTDETGTGSAVFGTSPTITTPTLAGTVARTLPAVAGYLTTYQGTKLRILEYVNEQEITAAANTQAIATWTVLEGTSVRIEFTVVMKAAGTVAKAASYKAYATYQRQVGGSAAAVGSPVYDTAQETTAGDNAAFNLAGNNVQVDITWADGDDRNFTVYVKVYEVLAGAGAAFDPSTVSGLRIWYDAADATGTAPVTAIDDQSANNNDPTISGAPTRTMSNASFNNLPTIFRNDATPDVITSGNLGITGTNPFTLVFVGNAPTAAYNYLMRNGVTGCPDLRAQGGVIRMSADGGVTLLDSAAVTVTNPMVIVAVYNGASSKLYVNKLTPVSGNAGTHISMTGAGVSIGTNATSAGNLNFGEAMVYSGALSQADCEYLLNGLGAKYAITIGA